MLFVLANLSVMANAVVDVYEFNSQQDEQRYQHLITEMRCPMCQNQNLNGSDSQIAKDLRRELHRLITEGESDKDIKNYMVERYGDYILYRPRLTENTLFLWFTPIALLTLGLVILTIIVRRRTTAGRSAVAAMTEEEQQKLQAMLKESE